MFCQPYKSAVPEGVGGFMTKAKKCPSADQWHDLSAVQLHDLSAIQLHA
jgi:hypothetical protein